MIFLTADTHYSHHKVIEYCNRPFSSVEEMNEALIANWNRVVKPIDTIYHLGDFALCKPAQAIEIAKRLNGHKHLIFGNHDKSLRKSKEFLDLWESTQDLKEIKVSDETALTGARKIVMCHYPLLTWNGSSYLNFSTHGHCHGNLFDDPHALRCDVGVDCWNYTPVSFEQIRDKLNTKTFKPIDHHKAD